MRWPFALRSTVHNLRLDNITLRAERDHSAQQARDWHDRLVDAQQRVTELTDSDRTSPKLMAQIFQSWSDEKQAAFLNFVGEMTNNWEIARCMQFGQIEKHLNDDGREFLKELARYATPESV